jgi:predicted Rossmann fold flavoprotein
MDYEVIVVGAGAAGLLAATRSAERGRRTLLLEKGRRPGVKILMSGGTRCNITHDTDERGIVEAFGKQGRFLHSALAALSPADLLALFHAEGVLTKVEPTGKIFPVSDQAADVLDALLRRLDRSGARLTLQEPVRDIRALDNGFEITTPQRILTCARLILTTGGQSYPGSGTTGDAYAWIQKLGHTLVSPRPALVPLTVAEPWIRELRGVTLPDVEVRIVERGSASKEGTLARRRGGFLFAHFGLSGPAIMDVSRAVTQSADPATLDVVCDFLPEAPDAEADTWLCESSAKSGKKLLAGILCERLPRRLGEQLLRNLGVPADRKAAGLGRLDRNALVGQIKRCTLTVTGSMGYGKAEVTAGGVSLKEIDSRTMQSKLVPGLFVAGELLDLDGPIGGYNFQAAFSTGWLAGENV